MRDLVTEERIVDTEYGSYRLVYRLHEIEEEGWRYYGISVVQYYHTKMKSSLFDWEVIRGFSENFRETLTFLDTLVRELVFPVHLLSIADDWQYMTES